MNHFRDRVRLNQSISLNLYGHGRIVVLSIQKNCNKIPSHVYYMIIIQNIKHN